MIKDEPIPKKQPKVAQKSKCFLRYLWFVASRFRSSGADFKNSVLIHELKCIEMKRNCGAKIDIKENLRYEVKIVFSDLRV